MVTYQSTSDYLATTSSYQDKIVKIDKVIAALFVTLEKAATNEDISSYSLDDGQTKVMTQYKSASQVSASIEAMEKLRAYYNSKISGNKIVRLVDSKNLNGNRFGR
jgi:uncharacterized protein YejL (UPF0352 family)